MTSGLKFSLMDSVENVQKELGKVRNVLENLPLNENEKEALERINKAISEMHQVWLDLRG